jgi:hypothetical protein
MPNHTDHTEQYQRERHSELPRERRNARAPPGPHTRWATTAGLCLALVLATASALSATASASASWEQCTKGTSASTKWTTHSCTTASGSGEWQWREVSTTEEVRLKGSLKLTDTKVPIIGKVSVECFGESTGAVGPGSHGRITKVEISAAHCRNVENCEEIKEPEARDLPWQAESYQTEGKVFQKLTGAGSGEPGWKVTCKVLGISKSDECLTESSKPESTLLENKSTSGELLVLATLQHARKAKCSVGGAEAGEVSGSLAVLQANGSGLRVSGGGSGGGGEEEATSTTLTTSLSGEGTEREELTVLEGAKVKDKAKLSGTNASKAGGTVKYKVYSDNKCEKLVTSAGEVTVSSGSVPASSEEELEGGKTYYWQASYSGDSKNKSSTSTCGSEVLNVKAKTTLATTLSGESKESTEIEVVEGAKVADKATLTGTNSSTATGKVTYKVYSDTECKTLVTEAGEKTVTSGSVPASNETEPKIGTYYWQASYGGDSLHQASTSACGSEIAIVTAAVTTSLSGGGESGEEIEVVKETAVKDTATLYGEHTSTATGTVKYDVYSDSKCKELVKEAGEKTVTSGSVPTSNEETLSPGTYYWQADYSGDTEKPAEKSVCGTEVQLVQTATSLTTSLSGESKTGGEIEVKEEAAVKDSATLSGTNASTATGYVKYDVYSDSECKDLVAEAGDVSVTSGSVPESSEETLPVGTYYWQAVYSGDGTNHGSTSSCGSEISIVTAPVTTSLSGEEQSGREIEVEETAAVTDKATLHGPHASTATGTVKYAIYSDTECKDLVKEAGEVTVTSGSVPASSAETLAAGDYYWQASYSGNSENPAAKSACGTEVAIVKPPNSQYAAIGDSFTAGVGAGGYYTKTVVPGAEENKCYRSPKAYPARVAEDLFPGSNVTEEKEVFKRLPPKFIFRACNGAVANNLWREGKAKGQYNEWIEGTPGEWLTKPAQNLWLGLPGGEPVEEPNRKITLVTLTIGGNDAGFAIVGENCTNSSSADLNTSRNYSPARCKEVIEEWETGVAKTPNTLLPPEKEGIPSIKSKLPVVLGSIHEFAPNARIRIPLYPQLIDTAQPDPITLGTATLFGYGRTRFYVDNPVVRPNSVAVALERFVDRLNQTVASTVQKWVRERKVDAEIIPGTVRALSGHQLGDATLWVNPLTVSFLGVPEEGSLHPNCLGQRALAEEVVDSLGRVVPGGWTCP